MCEECALSPSFFSCAGSIYRCICFPVRSEVVKSEHVKCEIEWCEDMRCEDVRREDVSEHVKSEVVRCEDVTVKREVVMGEVALCWDGRSGVVRCEKVTKDALCDFGDGVLACRTAVYLPHSLLFLFLQTLPLPPHEH